VWTPREFQTVGAAAQNALAANNTVAGCCCRRAEVERRVLETDGNREFRTVGTPAVQTAVPYVTVASLKTIGCLTGSQ